MDTHRKCIGRREENQTLKSALKLKFIIFKLQIVSYYLFKLI